MKLIISNGIHNFKNKSIKFSNKKSPAGLRPQFQIGGEELVIIIFLFIF